MMCVCVLKMVCDKDVCGRWCVVCDKDVCERLCVKDGVTKCDKTWCVTKMCVTKLCDKMCDVCVKDGA